MSNKTTSQPSPLIDVLNSVCVCVTGDDMEHEQDTVLQLQEVIEQLRNVFPSEPGEFTYGARIVEAAALRASETDSMLLHHPHVNERRRGE